MTTNIIKLNTAPINKSKWTDRCTEQSRTDRSEAKSVKHILNFNYYNYLNDIFVFFWKYGRTYGCPKFYSLTHQHLFGIKTTANEILKERRFFSCIRWKIDTKIKTLEQTKWNKTDRISIALLNLGAVSTVWDDLTEKDRQFFFVYLCISFFFRRMSQFFFRTKILLFYLMGHYR